MSFSDTTKYYENKWTQWDDMKTHGPMSKHVRRIIFRLLKDIDFESVADIGCGVGTLLAELEKLKPNLELTGTELYPDSLKIAQKRLPQATFKQLDLVAGKLKPSFDLTLCVDVFEHIPEDEKAMKHLAKMTKKYALIVVPLGPLFEVETARVGHVHGYSKKEFDTKLRKAGLIVVTSVQWGFPFYNLYRRLLHRLPESTTTGKYTWKKKLTSQILYWMLFLNSNSRWGERYFVLCQKKSRS